MEEENGTSEVVRWERFLPQTVLRVLLVEQDDSTRHVISALLRKCSYKVTSVSDGLEAWAVLKEEHGTIDIILTEVELPSISGFTLLTLVMDHDVCRRIPVIMMSSQDSISTVLKCMLKGAADFLIKPIRKNELKNLWQHVWRKQMSTAEIKSLSTGEEQKKTGATSDKMAASSQSNDYISSEQPEVVCEWTKSISKDFSQPDCEDPVDHRRITTNLDEESLRTDKDSGHGSKIEEKPQLETLCNGNSNSIMLSLSDDGIAVKRAKHDDSEGTKFQGEHNNGTFVLHGRGALLFESPSLAAVDLIGSFGAGKRKYEISNAAAHSSCDSQLELTLQGSNPSGPKRSRAEGHFLNHSSASAFSRYNSSDRFRPSLPPSFMVDSKSLGTVNESKHLNQSHLQISISNNGDSSTAVINGQSDNFENASASFLGWGTHQTDEPIQSMIQLSHPGCSKLEKGTPADAESSFGVHERENKSNKGVRTQLVAFGPCSSTLGGTNSVYMCTDFEDGNEHARNVKWDNDSGISNATTHKSRIDFPLGNGPIPRLDSILSRERQAALIKFREKRKKRCFDKKVRYQSRKQLAEQRPRVKGQFVRQILTDSVSSAG